MEHMICPVCKQSDVEKYGTHRNKQRYRCLECEQQFTVAESVEAKQRFMVRVLQYYLEGCSAREIEKILGISHATVSRWIKDHEGLPCLPHRSATIKNMCEEKLLQYMEERKGSNKQEFLLTKVGDTYSFIAWEGEMKP